MKYFITGLILFVSLNLNCQSNQYLDKQDRKLLSTYKLLDNPVNGQLIGSAVSSNGILIPSGKKFIFSVDTSISSESGQVLEMEGEISGKVGNYLSGLLNIRRKKIRNIVFTKVYIETAVNPHEWELENGQEYVVQVFRVREFKVVLKKAVSARVAAKIQKAMNNLNNELKADISASNEVNFKATGSNVAFGYKTIRKRRIRDTTYHFSCSPNSNVFAVDTVFTINFNSFNKVYSVANPYITHDCPTCIYGNITLLQESEPGASYFKRPIIYCPIEQFGRIGNDPIPAEIVCTTPGYAGTVQNAVSVNRSAYNYTYKINFDKSIVHLRQTKAGDFYPLNNFSGEIKLQVNRFIYDYLPPTGKAGK